MGKLPLEIADEPTVGNAGLAGLDELMRIGGVDSICAKWESQNFQGVDRDILRRLGGLIAMDNVGFDHTRQFEVALMATRRRLRTIMQGMMHLCGRLVRHSRRIALNVASGGGFDEARVGMRRRLAQV